MHGASWLMMTLAFLLGLVLTLAFTIRRVEREVPVSASAGGAAAKPAHGEAGPEAEGSGVIAGDDGSHGAGPGNEKDEKDRKD